MEEATKILRDLDGLLEGILSAFEAHSMLLTITSDHGNLEDLSTKSHTRNPVPLIAVGKGHKTMTRNAKNLTDITPAAMHLIR